MPWEAGGISGKLQDPRGGQVSREGASDPLAWVASAALSLLRSHSLEAATGKKNLSPSPFIFLASCVLNVTLNGPLKQHELPQTFLFS